MNTGRTDVLTPRQRSKCMSRIRGKDTGPEVRLRKALWAAGLRYRLQYKLLGRPDIVFAGSRIAVFVDGFFWHGCPEHGTSPKTNAKFWRAKIQANVQRDKKVNAGLREQDWTVLRCWEHDIESNLPGILAQIVEIACDRKLESTAKQQDSNGHAEVFEKNLLVAEH